MDRTEIEKKLEGIRQNGGAEVMKASAGSGKTYSLSREYIRVLLKGNREERHYHRHILAVTFTNKATENMKSEIVKSLDVIAHDPGSCEYAGYLIEQCGLSGTDQLQKAARTALNDILNDYSAFSISTIDKFFQRTLKAFAREIGNSSEYKVELDKDSLVAESVDRLLNSLSEEDTALLTWLSESSIEKMENGEGYHLESALLSFAKSYLSPEYDKKKKECGVDEEKAFTEANLKNLGCICRKIISEYDKGLSAAAGRAIDALDSLGVSGNNIVNLTKKLESYRNGSTDWKKPPQYWTNACMDFATVLKKDDAKIFPADKAAEMTRLLQDVDAYSGKPYMLRKTAGMLVGQVYVFRTAEALKQQYKALTKEKNVLGLDDTNDILRDIIGGTDAPFIYEKTGTRFKHFLLDEFQDTSVIQWDCIKPLLQNSISEGCYNLIVGDVKQSIYRWRDADWHILGSQVESDLNTTAINPLDVNWRSSKKVIEFNNGFYRYMAEIHHQETLYEGVEQKFSGKVKVPGCVDVTFCDSARINAFVLDAVHRAKERKFDYKDIAIIVRTNKQGGMIADYLSANGISVITDDSLKISSSRCVREVIAGLGVIDDPCNLISRFASPDFNQEETADARSIFEMADMLMKQLPVERTNAETLYILAFMDMIRDFVSNHGNSLHAFLEYWKEKGYDRKISCPKGTDAVTIITIHKSKGLDYPYVILPLRSSEPVMDSRTSKWEMPATEGTPLAECEPALYNVVLSKESLFSDGYDAELEMSTVDYINTWYVAMTRAVEEMCIIAPTPNGKCPLSSFLHDYVSSSKSGFTKDASPRTVKDAEDCKKQERFIFGEMSEKAPRKDEGGKVADMEIPYIPEEGCGRSGFIRISSDASEYFTGDGEMSSRKRGIILHGIMQNINMPKDLHEAVQKAVEEGSLAAGMAESTEETLARAIASADERGWFPEDAGKVLSERDIISSGSESKRPDRVVFNGGRVEIIDYKFGEPQKKYARQVHEYMDLYRAMGYGDVHGYLWYVDDGKIQEVD